MTTKGEIVLERRVSGKREIGRGKNERLCGENESVFGRLRHSIRRA